MACNLKRIADLPVPEEYKIALIEFFQQPANQAACEQLNQASDEELMMMIQQVGDKLKEQGGAPGGPPPGGPPPGGPPPGGPPQGMQAPPQAGPQGIASMQQAPRPQAPRPQAPRPQAPPGMPPNQVSHVPNPMSTPVGIRGVPPRRY